MVEINKLKEDARAVKSKFNDMITELKQHSRRTEIVNARMRRRTLRKEQKEISRLEKEGRRNLHKMILQEKIDEAEKKQIEELDNAVDFILIVNTIEQIESLVKKLEENKENDKQVKEIEEKIQALMETLKGLLEILGSISFSFASGLLDATIRILKSTGGLLKVLGKGLGNILGMIGSKTLDALKVQVKRMQDAYDREQARLKREREWKKQREEEAAQRREEEAAQRREEEAAQRRASASARRDRTVTSMFGSIFGPSTRTQTVSQTRSNRSSPSRTMESSTPDCPGRPRNASIMTQVAALGYDISSPLTDSHPFIINYKNGKHQEFYGLIKGDPQVWDPRQRKCVPIRKGVLGGRSTRRRRSRKGRQTRRR